MECKNRLIKIDIVNASMIVNIEGVYYREHRYQRQIL